MSTLRSSLNGPLTIEERIRIKRFIALREASVKAITNCMKEEQDQIDVCTNAISNLEIAIPEGKELLHLHEENLSALLRFQSRLKYIPIDSAISTQPEPRSEQLIKKMRNCVLRPFNRGSSDIREHLDTLEQEVRSMIDSIRELELESEMCNRRRIVSTKLLEEMEVIITAETRCINEATKFLKPIWNIPFDVWRIIFKLVVDDKLDTFLRDPNANPLRSEALKISQVCHHWRQMTSATPELWRYVSAPPHPQWRPNEHKILLHAISRSSEPVTLVYNLSQSYHWGYDAGGRYDERGYDYISEAISISDSIFSTNDYAVQYHMVTDLTDISSRAANTPFRQPARLTLSVLPSACRNHVFSQMAIFDKTFSLTFLTHFPQSENFMTVSNKFPSVTILKFILRQFPTNFDLAGFLRANLEELHVRHEVDAELPQIPGDVSLPKLRVLGVTYPAHNLFAMVRVPVLRDLVFYGPANSRHRMAPSGHNLDNIFRRLSHLRFEDWSGSMEDSRARSAAVFGEIVLNTPNLQSVKFTRCYVDGEELTKAMGGVSLGKLEEMTLSQPVGITREQCDQLKTMVPRLNIYV